MSNVPIVSILHGVDKTHRDLSKFHFRYISSDLIHFYLVRQERRAEKFITISKRIHFGVLENLNTNSKKKNRDREREKLQTIT